MNGTTYKVHLDGYNNLDHWTGKSTKSARREIFYYDETDLMAVRVDAWKMHIGVKHEGQLVEREVLPERAVHLQPADGSDGEDGSGVATSGATSAASSSRQKLWAPTAAGPFIAAHLKSLRSSRRGRAPTRSA